MNKLARCRPSLNWEVSYRLGRVRVGQLNIWVVWVVDVGHRRVTCYISLVRWHMATIVHLAGNISVPNVGRNYSAHSWEWPRRYACVWIPASSDAGIYILWRRWIPLLIIKAWIDQLAVVGLFVTLLYNSIQWSHGLACSGQVGVF